MHQMDRVELYTAVDEVRFISSFSGNFFLFFIIATSSGIPRRRGGESNPTLENSPEGRYNVDAHTVGGEVQIHRKVVKLKNFFTDSSINIPDRPSNHDRSKKKN